MEHDESKNIKMSRSTYNIRAIATLCTLYSYHGIVHRIKICQNNTIYFSSFLLLILLLRHRILSLWIVNIHESQNIKENASQ